MYILIGIIILIILSAVVFMKQPKFGKLPKGVRFERIKKSFNKIKEYARFDYPNETCGIIDSEGKVIRLKNIADDMEKIAYEKYTWKNISDLLHRKVGMKDGIT